MSTLESLIRSFLDSPRFAVVGASTDRGKYGNKVLRAYMQHGKTVTPVNPKASEVEGLPSVPDLAGLVDPTNTAISIITPPAVTLKVVEEAAGLGIKRLWMQPGAESAEAVARAQELGLDLIAGGPCLLVVMGFHE